MTHQIITPSATQNQTSGLSRRAALRATSLGIAGAGAALVAWLLSPAAQALESAAHPWREVEAAPPVEDCQCPHCRPDLWQEVESKAPPYPDPARTAQIDGFRAELDRAITALETFWGFLGAARALPPDEVDGLALIGHISDTICDIERLTGLLDCKLSDELVQAVTGEDSYIVYLEYSLATDGLSQAQMAREIETQREDRPAAYEKLLRLYTAKYPVAP